MNNLNNIHLQQLLQDVSMNQNNGAVAQQLLANANLAGLNPQLQAQLAQMSMQMNQQQSQQIAHQIQQQTAQQPQTTPAESDWRQETPEADRNKLVSALAQELRTLSPAIEDAKILAVAQSFEVHTFQKAASRKDYIQICAKKLSQIRTQIQMQQQNPAHGNMAAQQGAHSNQNLNTMSPGLAAMSVDSQQQIQVNRHNQQLQGQQQTQLQSSPQHQATQLQLQRAQQQAAQAKLQQNFSGNSRPMSTNMQSSPNLAQNANQQQFAKQLAGQQNLSSANLAALQATINNPTLNGLTPQQIILIRQAQLQHQAQQQQQHQQQTQASNVTVNPNAQAQLQQLRNQQMQMMQNAGRLGQQQQSPRQQTQQTSQSPQISQSSQPQVRQQNASAQAAQNMQAQLAAIARAQAQSQVKTQDQQTTKTQHDHLMNAALQRQLILQQQQQQAVQTQSSQPANQRTPPQPQQQQQISNQQRQQLLQQQVYLQQQKNQQAQAANTIPNAVLIAQQRAQQNQQTPQQSPSQRPQLQPSPQIGQPNQPDNTQAKLGQTSNPSIPNAIGRIPHNTAVETVAEMNRQLVAARPRTTEETNLTDSEKAAIIEQVALMTPMFQRVDQLLPVFLAMTGNIDATKRLILMKYMFQDQLDVIGQNRFVFNLVTLQKLKDQFQRYFQFVKNQISNPQNRARLQQEAASANTMTNMATNGQAFSPTMSGAADVTAISTPVATSNAAQKPVGMAVGLTPQQIALAQSRGATSAQIQALQQALAAAAAQTKFKAASTPASGLTSQLPTSMPAFPAAPQSQGAIPSTDIGAGTSMAPTSRVAVSVMPTSLSATSSSTQQLYNGNPAAMPLMSSTAPITTPAPIVDMKRPLNQEDMRLPPNKRRQIDTSPQTTMSPPTVNKKQSPRAKSQPSQVVKGTKSKTNVAADRSPPIMIDLDDSQESDAIKAVSDNGGLNSAALLIENQRNQLRASDPFTYVQDVVQELCRNVKTGENGNFIDSHTHHLLADVFEPIISSRTGPSFATMPTRRTKVEDFNALDNKDDWFKELLKHEAIENGHFIPPELDDNGNEIDVLSIDAAHFQSAFKAVARLGKSTSNTMPVVTLENSFEDAPAMSVDAAVAAAMEIVV